MAIIKKKIMTKMPARTVFNKVKPVGDSKTCAECRAKAGSGEKPPFHPNCRCNLGA